MIDNALSTTALAGKFIDQSGWVRLFGVWNRVLINLSTSPGNAIWKIVFNGIVAERYETARQEDECSGLVVRVPSETRKFGAQDMVGCSQY